MKKLNYYFMIVVLTVSTFFLQCLTSCSEDEKVVPPLDIPSTLNNSSVKKMFCFDGMEGELSNVKFELLSAINESNGKVYEAEMEMTLPMSIRTETATMTYNPFKFKVRALSAEGRITFNGDCLYGMGDMKLSVEGLYKDNLGWDSLHINLIREAPQASFAGKTFELVLNEETFDLDEISKEEILEWNEPLPLSQYAKDGMAKYTDYLKDKTQNAIYQFAFEVDGNLVIRKRDSQMQDFETLPGRFKYYLADDEIGFIEVGKECAADFVQLLTANENANPQGLFGKTYIFDDVLEIPFCYRDRGTTLWLAIGDKTGFKNMNDILFNWRTMATDYYNMDESDPLGLVYMVWSKHENSKNQIWWKLNEK